MNALCSPLMLVFLVGCPWIRDHALDDEDTDVDVGTEVCEDVDFDGICDPADACVDGVDDVQDQYDIRPGDAVTGQVCWQDDVLTMPVDAGCTASFTLTSPTTVDVDLVHGSGIIVSGTSPASAEVVLADYQPLDFVVSGTDAEYTLQATMECPSCRGGRRTLDWGDVATERLCPERTAVQLLVPVADTRCQYGVTVITSEQTTTSVSFDDGSSVFDVSGDSGYLSLISPVSADTTVVAITLSQPTTPAVEQGVWAHVESYCDE